MSIKSLIYAITIGIVLTVIFYLFPKIDLKVAALFYQKPYHFYFDTTTVTIIRKIFSYSFVAVFLGATMLILIVRFFHPAFLSPKIKSYTCIYLLLCFIIGPVLVVNIVFKDHWGRARPRDVQQFGGHKIFQKPWMISNQCVTNCSFPSGEASEGFFFFAFLPLLKRRKKLITVTAIIAGLTIGLIRMGVGAHFLSDVLFSGVIMYITTWWCCYYFFGVVLTQTESDFEFSNTDHGS